MNKPRAMMKSVSVLVEMNIGSTYLRIIASKEIKDEILFCKESLSWHSKNTAIV